MIGANVTTILRRVRSDAGYDGQLVIVNYYSLNYADPASTAASQALNQAMDTAAAPFDVRVAEGFGAFQTAAVQAGGDSCAAGLLTKRTTGGCGCIRALRGSSCSPARSSGWWSRPRSSDRSGLSGCRPVAGAQAVISGEMLRMRAVSCFHEPSGVCLMGR